MSGGGPGGACLAQVAVAASSSRRDPMGRLQRTSDPASTTSSQDPPWLGRHERNSLVKNRMREICTSGSGGVGSGNVPTYSASLLLERCETCGEGLAVMQVLDFAKEREPACRVGVGERRQEQPPEQARKHLHRQEKAGLAAHPVRAVERYPAARHNHMDVRMVGHCRAPAVEHGGGAEARAEVL